MVSQLPSIIAPGDYNEPVPKTAPEPDRVKAAEESPTSPTDLENAEGSPLEQWDVHGTTTTAQGSACKGSAPDGTSGDNKWYDQGRVNPWMPRSEP